MAIQDQLRGEFKGHTFHIFYQEETNSIITSVDGLPIRVKALTPSTNVDQELDKEVAIISRALKETKA